MATSWGCVELELESRVADVIRDLLSALGEDVTRSGVVDTPERAAAAMLEATMLHRMRSGKEVRGQFARAIGRGVFTATPPPQTSMSMSTATSASGDAAVVNTPTGKTLPNTGNLVALSVNGNYENGNGIAVDDDDDDEEDEEEEEEEGGENDVVVCVQEMNCYILDGQCLLPRRCRVGVSYRPRDGSVLGLSKFARVVNIAARRIQSAETLAAAVAQAVDDAVKPRGLCVRVDAQKDNDDDYEIEFLTDEKTHTPAMSRRKDARGVAEDADPDTTTTTTTTANAPPPPPSMNRVSHHRRHSTSANGHVTMNANGDRSIRVSPSSSKGMTQTSEMEVAIVRIGEDVDAPLPPKDARTRDGASRTKMDSKAVNGHSVHRNGNGHSVSGNGNGNGNGHYGNGNGNGNCCCREEAVRGCEANDCDAESSGLRSAKTAYARVCEMIELVAPDIDDAETQALARRYTSHLLRATSGYSMDAVVKSPPPRASAESNGDSTMANGGTDSREYHELSLPISSLCEHHILPFTGYANIVRQCTTMSTASTCFYTHGCCCVFATD